MIFPLDVYRKVSETRKLVGQDRTAVLIQLFLLINVVCYFVLRFFFNSILQVSTKWALVAQIFLFFVFGYFYFRFIIFREDEKINEYKNAENDSFARYLQVRKDSETVTEIAKKKVHVFEFANGTATCVLCFKFGSNDDVKASNTFIALDTILGLIADYGFESRVVSAPEDFRKSKEFQNYVDKINSINNRQLAFTLKEISDAVLQTSYEESNVDCIYVCVRTSTSYQKGELEGVIKAILKTLYETVTAFRSFEFLDMAELLEFYRYFYTVAAIDLAMMRAIDLAADLDDDYNRIVSLHSLVSTDNKRYRIDDETDAFSMRERSLNE